MEKYLKISIIVVIFLIFGSMLYAHQSKGNVKVVGEYVIEVTGLEIGETLGEEMRTLSDEQVPFLLKGGLIVTKEGSTDYTQSLRFFKAGDDPIESGRVVFTSDEANRVSPYLFFKEKDDIFEYEISFGSGLESRIDNGRLIDIEDEVINILGQNFVFVNSAVDKETKMVGFTLVSGKAFDRMQEGETRTFQTASQLIRLTLLNVNENTAKAVFEVNGRRSKGLGKGDTEVMPNGFRIAVKDVIPNEAGDPGIPDFVELYLGTMKIEFRDRYDDALFGAGGVKLQNQNIDHAKVSIIGTEMSADRFEINSIRYRLQARAPDGDIYIPAKGTLRNHLKYPQAMLSNVWDIRYGGLGPGVKAPDRAIPTTGFPRTMEGGSLITFDPSGVDSYKLKYTSAKGSVYSIPFVDNSGGFKYGDEDSELIFNEPGSPTGFNIEKKDYFLLVDSPVDRNSHSAVFRYDSIDLENKIITFTDMAIGTKKVKLRTTGTDQEVGNIGIGMSVLGIGELISGGYQFKVLVSPGPGNPLSIDLNNDKEIDGDQSKIVVRGGGILDIGAGQSPGNSIDVTIRTEGSQFDNPKFDEVVTIKVMADGNRVDLRVSDQANLKMYSTKDGNFEQGMTDYGVFFNMQERSGKPNVLEINYPIGQRLPTVRVTG